jgi:hypothetical protein
MITPYHAKHYAHELTRRCPSDSVEKLAGTLVDAQVDLNPHQVDAALFEAEAVKLDGWADDLKLGLEREIKALDRQIKDARRAATAALTLEDKLAGQKQVKALEVQRNTKRRTLFDAQDDIDAQRERLIAQIEGKLQQKTSLAELFAIRWSLT